MRLLEKIKAVYDNSPAKPLAVPEWGVTVYFRPLKGDELDVVKALTPADCTPTRSNAQVVVIKALDANGVRLFKNDEADDLYASSFPEVINRIAIEMWKTPSVAEAEKNSVATPTS